LIKLKSHHKIQKNYLTIIYKKNILNNILDIKEFNQKILSRIKNLLKKIKMTMKDYLKNKIYQIIHNLVLENKVFNNLKEI
jgi:hypothetical protein